MAIANCHHQCGIVCRDGTAVTERVRQTGEVVELLNHPLSFFILCDYNLFVHRFGLHIKMETSTFNGLSDVDDFIFQFKILAQIKKYEPEQSQAAIAAYLSGPALQFYKANHATFTSFEDVLTKLKNEFPSSQNYVQSFYYRRQETHESPIIFYYALEALASKAGNIVETDFITHFIKNLHDNVKLFFTTSAINTKAELKAAIQRYNEYHSQEQKPSIVIPIKENQYTMIQSQQGGNPPSPMYISSPNVSTAPQSAFSTPIPVHTPVPVCATMTNDQAVNTPVNRNYPAYNFRQRTQQNYRGSYQGNAHSRSTYRNEENHPNADGRRGTGAARR